MAETKTLRFWGFVGTLLTAEDPQTLEDQWERMVRRFTRKHHADLAGVLSFRGVRRRGDPHLLYVAGPMTGISEWNAPAFQKAQSSLMAQGWEVVTPLDLVPVDHPDQIPAWEDCLRHDLQAVLLCDGVALLPGWEQSRGASLEVRVANTVGIPVKTVALWLEMSPAASL